MVRVFCMVTDTKSSIYSTKKLVQVTLRIRIREEEKIALRQERKEMRSREKVNDNESRKMTLLCNEK